MSDDNQNTQDNQPQQETPSAPINLPTPNDGEAYTKGG